MQQLPRETNRAYSERLIGTIEHPPGTREEIVDELVDMLIHRQLLDQIEAGVMIVRKGELEDDKWFWYMKE